MIKLTAEELKEKIEKHRKWLENADGGERLAVAYDLRGANLDCANLRGANLIGANLDCAKNIPYVPVACPTHGEFIAWKKVKQKIVKLKILEDAKRCSATGRKCRCDKALVLAIENTDGSDSGLSEILNENYAGCLYKVGEMVYPDSFDDNRWNECSHGIHFFVDRGEAKRWQA